MLSKKIINSKNLIDNITYIKQQAFDKKVCVMVKADAYGHGMKEITELLKDEVEFFGVSNQEEALELRKYNCTSRVIVFGACEDYKICMQQDIDFALFSYPQLKEVIKIAKKNHLIPKLHLNINTGMNRFGIQTKKEMNKIISLLQKNDMMLEGIYTHFSSLTSDPDYTDRQKILYDYFVSFLPQDWNVLKHVGGGNSLFEDYNCDMVRVGMLVYGYGNEFVKPVMSIESQVVDMQYVKSGEHVGYLCGYTAPRDIVVATIPLGYADGLPRLLSNNCKVKINNKWARSCGNICMDSFMVDVSEINAKVGDKVQIMVDATAFSEICGTTCYEVCTNFIKLRAQTIIK